MSPTIFLSMLFTLQLFYWVVGKRASKGINTQEDYLLAGKNVRLFPLAMTFLATQVGGGTILGSAEEAYRYGWAVLFYPLGVSLGLIALGLGIGGKLSTLNLTTVAELFEKVYRSKGLRKFASLLSMISLFMILVAQVIASNKFLISMGINQPLLFVAFWGIVIAYTAQGGLKAVISTDLTQAAVFSAIFLFCFGFAFYGQPALLSPSGDFEAVSSKITGWLLMPLLFMIIEQDMGQRCFAGASARIVSKAAILSGIGTMIICTVPVFFGAYAKQAGLEIPQGASVLMTVIGATTSPWLSGLVGCAVLAAIISTATSLISAISSNLGSDFPLLNPKGSGSLKWVKGATIGFSIGAIFFAFYLNGIVDLMIQSYELSLSCLFVPIVFAIWKKEGNYASALTSVIFGMGGFLLFLWVPISFPKEIASILLSFLGYGLGEAYASIKARQFLPQTE